MFQINNFKTSLAHFRHRISSSSVHLHCTFTLEYHYTNTWEIFVLMCESMPFFLYFFLSVFAQPLKYIGLS